MSALLVSMLLLGLASGLHCVGMCGGIVVAFSARDVTLVKKQSQWGRQMLFNLGRILSYAAAGAGAGALGSAAGYAGAALPAQAMLNVLASVVLVLVGLQLAGVRNPLAFLERAGAPLWTRISPLAGRLLGSSTPFGAFGAGTLWGFLPCGLVYGALAAAVFAGSPQRGAAAMAAFGLGTLPWLLAAGVAAARLRGWMGRRTVRLAAASFVAAFGVWGLAHASGLAEQVRHSLLCL